MKSFFPVITIFAICLITSPAICADRVVVVPLGSKAKIEQQSFVYQLQPSDFKKMTDTAPETTFMNNGEYLSVNGASSLVAPIKLPVGATITQINCSVYDNSSDSNFNASSFISFWRRSPSSTTTVAFANPVYLNTVGSSSLLRPTLMPTLIYPTIANGYIYGARIDLLFTSPPIVYSQLRFYGCQLWYTLDVVVP